MTSVEQIGDAPRRKKDPVQPYGDLVQLNTSRLIADSVAEEVLSDIMDGFLDLLHSSAAIHESNGDYAACAVRSGWCRLLDAASRRLCQTEDNREALACGQWHCHQSCWETSRAAIETGQRADLPCLGGIRILAVPIRAAGKIVGSINVGYGDPPQAAEKLHAIAERYGVSYDELREKAETCAPCSPELLQVAKNRLQTSAKLIGALVELKQADKTIHQLNLELEQRETDRTAQLEAANRKLRAEIAEQKQAEQELRKLFAAVEHSPASIVITDLSGRIEYVNPKFCEVTGYRADEVVGENPRILKSGRTPPEQYEDLWRTITSGREWHGEFQNKKKNGELFWESASVSPVFSAQGETTHFVAVKVDITERKEVEEAASAARQAWLERQHQQWQLVEKELEKVKAELVRSTRMAAIGQVAAQIAHELRNPLGSVRNAAFYLRQIVGDRNDGSAEELRDFLSVIDQEVDTCNWIIGNLLEATNPKTVVKRSVDLGELVRAEFARLDLPQGVQCRFQSVPDPYFVHVDPIQWRQVISNLVANSLDAMGHQGRIELRAARSDEFDELTIHDTGPGIPAADRPLIFDLLFTTKAKGTGLGLAICRQIVEGHGGTIQLADEQDEGTTFVIRLPRETRPDTVRKKATSGQED